MTLERRIWIGAIAAVVAFAIVSRWQLARARSAAEDNALRATNAIAAADVSRKTALRARDSARILGDSLQSIERLGIQTAKPVKVDELDRATGRTSVARGNVTVTPGTIRVTAASPSLEKDDVRSASFHVDSARFTADVDVKIPRPPAQASLRLGVSLPPIELEPRIQCGPPDRGGIRPATLLVVAPAGVDVVVRSLELDAHACNPDFGKPRGIRVPLWMVGAGAAAGVVAGALILH